MSDTLVINTSTEYINLSVITTTEQYNVSVVDSKFAYWGTIFGVLSTQTDLWRVLSAKALEVDLQSLSGQVVDLETFIAAVSGTWNGGQEALTVLAGNSAFWDTAFARSTVFSSVSSRYNNSSTVVESSSANWNFGYDVATYVQANSANWEESSEIIPTVTNYLSTVPVTLSSIDVKGQMLSAGTDLFDIFLTSETDSQTLNYIPSSYNLSISNGNTVNLSSIVISPNANAVFNTVSAVALSGIFYGDGSNLIGASLPGQKDINTIVQSSSGNWNTAYNTATAYSSVSSTFATNSTVNSVSSLLTPLTLTNDLTSQLVLNTDFNNYRTSVAAATATLLPTTIYQNASGNWQGTYTNVESNSANWNTAFNRSTVFSSVSGRYDSTSTVVESNSAKWNDTSTVVQQGSSNWYSASGAAFNASKGYSHQNFVPLSGGAVIQDSLTISGDLYLLSSVYMSGSAFYVNAQDLIVSDPIIYIAEDNQADLLDIGFMASWTNAPGYPTGYQHGGLVRRADNKTWTLFSGSSSEPLSALNVEWSQSTIALEPLSAKFYGDIYGDRSVYGSLSSTGPVYGSNLNIANWDTAFDRSTVFSSASGRYDSSSTVVESNSANWNFGYDAATFVQANSANWEESADILPTVTNFLSTNNVRLSSATITDILSISSVQIRTRPTANVFIGDSTTGRDAATGNHNFVFGVSAGNALTTGISNNFFGCCAGSSNTTGSSNNFFGRTAGRANTTGVGNNFLGLAAGRGNTTGCFNNFLGSSAGECNTTGSLNNFFGCRTGCGNTTGVSNNFLGNNTGRYNTTGSNNNFFGHYTGYYNSTGSFNNFFGYRAGITNVTGSNNIIIGTNANVATNSLSGVIAIGTGAIATQTNQIVLSTANISLRSLRGTAAGPNLFIGDSTTGNNTATGNHNFVFGQCAGNALTTGYSNTFIGNDAGRFNTTGIANNFFGPNAGCSNTTGCSNNFFGDSAGRSNTTGIANNFFGRFAGLCNTTAFGNNFFGYNAGRCNTTGFGNNFIGCGAGCRNTTGSFNNFFGLQSGIRNTTGCANNFFGIQAGYYNTTGFSNNFFGQYAGRSNTTGCNNNFFGRFAGYYNTCGTSNNFFGYNAGRFNTTGFGNNFIGCGAGYNNNGRFNNFFGHRAGGGLLVVGTGERNNFFGVQAGVYNTTGNCNNFFGAQAGCTNTIGSNNTIIGTRANVATNSLSGVIVIGTGAIATESHQVVLSTANVLFRSTGNTFEIGSPSLVDNLTVYGILSSTQTIFASGGNSENWNTAFDSSTVFSSVSGRYDSSSTVVESNSANWDSTYQDAVTAVNGVTGKDILVNKLTTGNFDEFTTTYNSVEGFFIARTKNTTDGCIGIEFFDTGNNRVGFSILGARSGDGFLQGGSNTFRIEQTGGGLANLKVLGLKDDSYDFSFPSKSGTFALTDDLSSSEWNSTYTTVQNNSGNWNFGYSAATFVQANSANWEESAEILPTVTNYLSTSNVLISGLNVTTDIVANRIQATVKNFYIDHPTKPGKHLVYSSLEAPYNGIQLTGEGELVNGYSVVELPDYISKLIHPDNVHIQLTNYKHSKPLYVDSIEIEQNRFTVKSDSWTSKFQTLKFFWLLNGVRRDIELLQTEV